MYRIVLDGQTAVGSEAWGLRGLLRSLELNRQYHHRAFAQRWDGRKWRRFYECQIRRQIFIEEYV
jgi:hypothetical protein